MDSLINEFNTNSHIIVWTFIVFGLLLVILGKWGWPAILSALEAREQGIRDDLDAASQQREAAERLLLEHKKLMNDADDRIRAMVDEAKRDAEVIKAEFEKKAQEEAQNMRDRTLRDIDLAKNVAIGSLREESVNLSVRMAAKILNRELNASDHSDLVEETIKEINGDS